MYRLGAPLYGRHLALPTNVRLVWKGLPGTNTQAYYEKLKSFKTLVPEVDTDNEEEFVLLPSSLSWLVLQQIEKYFLDTKQANLGSAITITFRFNGFSQL